FGLRGDPVGQFVEEVNGTVVGVVRDFHILPMYETIHPLVMQFDPEDTYEVMVRLEAGHIAEGLAEVQQAWQRFVPERPLLYAFLDDELDEAYRAELRLGNLFGAFAVLAVVIACLGLFGLAAFTAERRTKEIGIRKVLGATVSHLVALLSKDFLKLVGVAFVIAAPLAYFIMSRWLEDFAYRIDLSVWIFVLAGAAALGIALLTVSYQALRAALTDPVKSLRYE
ncbi:MAG TPA: FtsX-like permease family protein, partial [Rhodothermales bacterium]|nr:FtsX-like permease family protein [Rhodothermales bacterium]